MTIEWRKSTRSGGGGTGGDCVELGDLSTAVGIRDSKSPDTGYLEIGRPELARLVAKIKDDELDMPSL
ncbi:DUF397 domain-containing protein [Actinomadura barringtoniae]|uniref:DUF397 domain-containing protein n=1 Tax=Actinomadura barringtoniae TaxID=1427535 RepID=A0A939TFR9_9ACTN|nr:DUF397 domain-containing protein [Actinomadura barringtoniae]MBO2454675.1 DUF397 domain-containing protein [Actinomadura barringtoniae]